MRTQNKGQRGTRLADRGADVAVNSSVDADAVLHQHLHVHAHAHTHPHAQRCVHTYTYIHAVNV